MWTVLSKVPFNVSAMYNGYGTKLLMVQNLMLFLQLFHYINFTMNVLSTKVHRLWYVILTFRFGAMQ